MYSDAPSPPPSILSRLSAPSAPTAPDSSSSLLNRLWTTKLVEFPEGEAGEVDMGILGRVEDGEKGDKPLREGDGEGVRATAMFVRSEGIQKLGTKEIIDLLAGLLPSRPIGLEWVNDTSVVILFRTTLLAQSAFAILTEKMYDNNGEENLITSGDFGGEEGWIRQATGGDVKHKGAASNSKFYKEQRQSRLQKKPYDRPGAERLKKWSSTTRDLDEELDAYTRDGGEGGGGEGGIEVRGRKTEELDRDLEELARRREEEGTREREY